MRNRVCSRHSAPIFALLLCLSAPLMAQSGSSIGVVLSSRGQVQARDATGVVRLLTRKSEIFAKDTILVGEDGMMQVRMNDDARISFKSNTEFSFNEYQFDNNPATPDNAVMSLVKGGFRTISGTVGHEKGDSYRVDTPMATIGIRGTTHGGVIEGDMLFTEVTYGGTTVSNNVGSLDLGLGGDFDYSQTARNAPPQGLLAQPLQLIQLNTLTQPPVADDKGEGKQGAAGSSTANASTNDTGNGNNTQQTAANNSSGTSSTASEDSSAPGLNSLGGGTDSGFNQPQAASTNSPSQNSPNVTVLLTTNNSPASPVTNVVVPTNTPGSNINPLFNSTKIADLVISSGGTTQAPPPLYTTELTNSSYVGMLVSTNAAGGSIAFGKALQINGGAGAPIISHNGFGQSVTSAKFLQIPADVIVSTVANASSGPPTSQKISSLDLDWGRWNKSELNVISNQLSNSSDAVPTNALEWAIFKPANMANLTGSFRYGNSSGIPVSGIDGTGASLRGGVVEFDVNLAGGVDAISNGLMRVFDSQNATWNVTFNGNINGAFATMTDISGTYKGTAPVTGAIGGAFTGTGPTPAFVSGFSLQSGSSFVQGKALLNKDNCIGCALPAH